MANRSDRHVANLSNCQGAKPVRLMRTTCADFHHGPERNAALHQQAGYMTATGYPAIRAATLRTGLGPYMTVRIQLAPPTSRSFKHSPGITRKSARVRAMRTVHRRRYRGCDYYPCRLCAGFLRSWRPPPQFARLGCLPGRRAEIAQDQSLVDVQKLFIAQRPASREDGKAELGATNPRRSTMTISMASPRKSKNSGTASLRLLSVIRRSAVTSISLNITTTPAS